MTSATSPFAPVEAELSALSENLKKLIGARHPVLYAAAEHLFATRGKGLRPALVLLVARATMPGHDITVRHRQLAEITEMIHTASLVHDDVIDTADVRRGVDTVNHLFDNRVAVLAGDYLFGKAAWYLASLDDLEVVKLLSKVIMDLPEGEIRQSLTRFDAGLSIDDYLEKSFYKTASLMSGSAKAAAVLSGVEPELAEHLYEFGRHFGIAFQIVDDILDFTGSEEILGKPVGSDLSQGNLTAPVLFALRSQPQLEPLIERQFAQPDDLQQALAWIQDSDGLEQSRELAAKHVHLAMEHLSSLPPSVSRQALIDLTEQALSRTY